MWKSFPSKYNQITQSLSLQPIPLSSSRKSLFSIQEDIEANIISDSNSFANVFDLSRQGAIFWLSSSMTLTDETSHFEGNAAFEGGAIYCDGCKMIFSWTTFEDHIAQRGGALYLKNSFNVQMSNVRFINSNSIIDGGSIYIIQDEVIEDQEAVLEIDQCKSLLLYSQAENDGGFIYVDHLSLILSIKNSVLKSAYAGKKGGLISSPNLKSVEFQSLLFQNMSAQNGSLIYSKSQGLNLKSQNLTIDCSKSEEILSQEDLLFYFLNEEMRKDRIKGALFEIYQANSIDIVQNKISKCQKFLEGSVYKVEAATLFQDKDSVYQQNSAIKGGVASISNSEQVVFQNTTFQESFSIYGGSLIILGNTNLKLDLNQIQTSTAYFDGGFLYFISQAQDGSNEASLQLFGQTSLKNCESIIGNGGCFYLDSPLLKLELDEKVSISGLMAEGAGALVYSKDSLEINLHDMPLIDEIYSSLLGGRLVYSEGKNSKIILENLIIRCGQFVSKDKSIQPREEDFDQGAVFHIIGALEVLSSNIDVQNCQDSYQGGIYYLEQTKIIDSGGSSFNNNDAYQGGIFYCKDCQIELTNQEFQDNLAVSGGLFFLSDNFNISINGMIANENYAFGTGSIVSTQDQSNDPKTQIISIKGVMNFDSNSAKGQGGLFFIDSQNANVLLQSEAQQDPIQILDSKSETDSGGVFYINRAKSFLLSNANVLNAFSPAYKNGSILFSESQDLEILIAYAKIICNTADEQAQAQDQSSAGALYIANTNIASSTLEDIQISGCQGANNGGAISVVKSTLLVKESSLKMNSAMTGGAIYCEFCQMHLIRSFISDNQAEAGGSLAFLNGIQSAEFDEVSIHNSLAFGSSAKGGSIYIRATTEQQSNSELLFSNIEILNSQSESQGGVFYIDSPQLNLRIANISVDQAQASHGGVFFISAVNHLIVESPGAYKNIYSTDSGAFMSQEGKLANQVTIEDVSLKCDENVQQAQVFNINGLKRFTIRKMIFSNCQSNQKGGIIYAKDVRSIEVKDSEFNNISTTQNGGIIYSSNSSSVFSNITAKNLSSFRGSAFYLEDLSPLELQDSNFSELLSQDSGGFIYIISTLMSQIESEIEGNFQIKLLNIKLSDCQAQNSAAGIYIDSQLLQKLILRDVDFQNFKSGSSGGLFYIHTIGGQVIISTLNPKSLNSFTNFSSSNPALNIGDFLYADSPNLVFSLENSKIQCITDDQKLKSYGLNRVQTIDSANAFAVNNVKLIESRNNIFHYCFGSNQGGVFQLEQTQFTDLNSRYEFNSAIKGGVFFGLSSQIFVQGSIFKNNFAFKGSIFFMNDNMTIAVEKAQIQSNAAIYDSAVLHSETIYDSMEDLSFFSFSQTTFKDNYVSQGQASFSFINNELASLVIIQCIIQNFSSSDSQALSVGLFYLPELKTLNFTQTTISNVQSSGHLVLFTQSINLQITINQVKLICDTDVNYNKENLLDYLKDSQSNEEPQYTLDSVIYISQAQSVKVSKSSFSQCGITLFGGIFFLSKTTYSDENSEYFDNAAVFGGAISAVDSKVSIKNSQFHKNYARQGGVIHLATQSFLGVQTSIFYKNYAFQQAGILSIITGSYATILGCEVFQNEAYENSVINILESSQTNLTVLENSQFYHNTAEKNSMTIIKGLVAIKNCQFRSNYAYQRSKNIFVGLSTIFIDSSYFEGDSSLINSDQLKLDELDKTQGSFIYAIISVNLNIANTIFRYGSAVFGGAIYVAGDSSIDLTETQFIKNFASIEGGAIYAQGFKNFTIASNSSFQDNFANEKGDDIYVTNTDKLLNMEQVQFSNPKAFLSIYVSQAIVKMNQVHMNGIGSSSLFDQSFGSALYCINCKQISILRSTFSNSRGTNGVLYIEETLSNRDQNFRSYNNQTYSLSFKYEISLSQFSNLTSISGGALYLQNPQSILISNSSFVNNSALNKSSFADEMGSGGAIFFNCDPSALDCLLAISKNSYFNSNYAARKGGAIHWEEIEPLIEKNSTNFSKNSAYLYGNDISCFAQKISKIDIQKYMTIMERYGYRMLQNQDEENKGSVQNQRSGGTLPDFYLSLVDQYGQIVNTDSESKMRVVIELVDTSQKEKYLYPATIDGKDQFQLQLGVVQISSMQFTGTPGMRYKLVLTSNGIDLNKLSNKQYLQQQGNGTDIAFNIEIELRKCEVGEYFTLSGQCISCPGDSSYSLYQMNEPGECQECPTDKAICDGGSTIGPQPGYWRSSNISVNFIKCNYYYACLGMVPPEYNPKGTCLEGFQGIICSDCQVGYSKQGDYKCASCPEKNTNIVRLLFILIAVIIMVAVIVRQTLQGAKENRNLTNIFIKIMMNHLQLVMLTASFNLSWPTSVINFYQGLQPVSQIASQAFSFDCFVDFRENQRQDNEQDMKFSESDSPFRIFYLKLALFALLPFGIVAMSAMFWKFYQAIRKLKQNMRNKIVTTCVILMFLVHPSIVQYMFDGFSCDKIDGVHRLTKDLQIICWGNIHKRVSYFIALPSLFVWGLGIPTFAYILLSRNKQNLEAIEVRERLGFLYRGYRLQYYYWEIVIVLRKIAIIFVRVFISSYGVTAQALIVFVLLTLLLSLNIRTLPFATQDLNNLESISLIASLVTIYCGIFFLTNYTQDVIEIDPELKARALNLSKESLLFLFCLIVVSNAFFFTFWLYKIYSEIEMKLANQLPRLYVYLFFCNNKDAFRRHHHELKLKEANENLRIRYRTIIKTVRSLYERGNLVLNQSNIEKLEIYLSQNKVKSILESETLKTLIGEKEDQVKQEKRKGRLSKLKELNANTVKIYKERDKEKEESKSKTQQVSAFDYETILTQELQSPTKSFVSQKYRKESQFRNPTVLLDIDEESVSSSDEKSGKRVKERPSQDLPKTLNKKKEALSPMKNILQKFRESSKSFNLKSSSLIGISPLKVPHVIHPQLKDDNQSIKENRSVVHYEQDDLTTTHAPWESQEAFQSKNPKLQKHFQKNSFRPTFRGLKVQTHNLKSRVQERKDQEFNFSQAFGRVMQISSPESIGKQSHLGSSVHMIRFRDSPMKLSRSSKIQTKDGIYERQFSNTEKSLTEELKEVESENDMSSLRDLNDAISVKIGDETSRSKIAKDMDDQEVMIMRKAAKNQTQRSRRETEKRQLENQSFAKQVRENAKQMAQKEQIEIFKKRKSQKAFKLTGLLSKGFKDSFFKGKSSLDVRSRQVKRDNYLKQVSKEKRMLEILSQEEAKDQQEEQKQPTTDKLKYDKETKTNQEQEEPSLDDSYKFSSFNSLLQVQDSFASYVREIYKNNQ